MRLRGRRAAAAVALVWSTHAFTNTVYPRLESQVLWLETAPEKMARVTESEEIELAGASQLKGQVRLVSQCG